MKKIIWAPAVFSLLAAVAAAVLLSVDFNGYKPEIAAAIENETGIPVEIRGDVRLKPTVVPTISVSYVHSQNVAWAKREHLLSVERVDVSPRVIPLFHGSFAIRRLVLAGVEINLETDGHGKANWREARSVKAVVKGGSAIGVSPPSIRELAVERLTVHFNFGWSQVERTYQIDAIEARSASMREPIRVSMQHAVLSLEDTVALEDFLLEGTLGSIDSFRRNEPFPVDLKGGFRNADLVIAGEIRAPQTTADFDLQLALETESAAELGSLAGYEVGWFEGRDLHEDKPLRITARARGDRNGYSLDDVVIRIGHVLIQTQH